MGLTKIPTHGIFKQWVGYIFSKYVHCDMQYLVEIISALPCFPDGFGINVPISSY